MPSQTSPPLTATMLAALWVSLCRCDVSGSPRPECDTGRLYLDRDLPEDGVYWSCSASSWPDYTLTHPGIDTVYDPEPATHICMDKSISYSHIIPNSGPYRPVRAESGEYLYCPPQRWLNNLHHAATVLLYHPCAPLHERLLLSVLARSCLPYFIITPHPNLKTKMPIALVAWGRTLELSTVASSGVCEWLETMTPIRNEFGSERRKYNLLLTWSAERHQQQHAHPEEQSANIKESVRQCCEQTIFSWLNAEMEAKLESHMKKKRPNQKKVVVNSREIRAVIGENQKYVLNDYAKQNSAHDSTGDVHSDSSTLGQSTGFTPLDPPKNPSLLDSNRSDMTLRTDGFEFGAAGSQASSLMLKPTSPTEYNHTAFPEMLALSPKGRGIESVNGRMKEKKSDTDTREDSLMKENEAVVFKEREQKQAYSDMDTQYKTEKTYQSVSPHQAQQQPNGQTATSLASSHDCDGCKTGKGCECNKDIGAEAKGTFLNKGWQKTPRTDEAVWAAAALGFLLVLLTLSVLHTRLYRHWRTMPSLYWHDPQQDYDNVADVIRRRLRIAKRRRKRSRRKECVLLPSSSSSDEQP